MIAALWFGAEYLSCSKLTIPCHEPNTGEVSKTDPTLQYYEPDSLPHEVYLTHHIPGGL